MVKPVNLSKAYHTENTFFVVSYSTDLENPNAPRELVNETFTNIEFADQWVSDNQKDFDDLVIHPAKLTGEVQMAPRILGYSE